MDHQKTTLDQFLEANKERYEIISELQYKLNHISQDSYPEIIKYVESHIDVFLKDYDSAILFIRNLIHFSIYNFKHLELILDIVVFFDGQMKKVNITDYDYLLTSSYYLSALNYLFCKNIISIQTIFNNFVNPEVFFNFYPEIESIDSTYAIVMVNNIYFNQKKVSKQDDYEDFFVQIRTNIEQHKINRSKNYHPSLLHQSIRNDDIDSFQKLISQNNISLNHVIKHSYYERACTKDKDLSLIQIAAVYGSIKVFKFLWMQKDIFPDENLLSYSYFGRNPEIIHICEKECSSKDVLHFAIFSHQNELVEYYMDNFEDEKDSDDYLEALKKYNDDENPYKNLNYQRLQDALTSMNWEIIIPCLPKIVYLIENYEVNSNGQNKNITSLLERSCKDLTLFKFLYQYKNHDFRFYNNSLYPYNFILYMNSRSVFHFLIRHENHTENEFLYLFYLCGVYFYEKLPILFDFWNEQKIQNVIDYVAQKISLRIFERIVSNYNEDSIVLILKTFPDLGKKKDFMSVLSNCSVSVSKPLFDSLIKRLSEFLPEESMKNIVKGNK